MPDTQATARKDSNGCMVTFLGLLFTTLTVLLAVGAAVAGPRRGVPPPDAPGTPRHTTVTQLRPVFGCRAP